MDGVVTRGRYNSGWYNMRAHGCVRLCVVTHPTRQQDEESNQAPEEMLMSPGTMMVTMAEELDKEAASKREKGRLWGTRKQRDLWLADVQGAATLSRMAYCAGALEEVGDGFVPLSSSK